VAKLGGQGNWSIWICCFQELGDEGRVHGIGVRRDMVDGRDCVFRACRGFGGVDAAKVRLLEGSLERSLRTTQTRRQQADSQSFKCRFDIWKLNKDRLVWNALVVEHETNAPYRGRETDTFGAC
jgi:hypothetical protein